MKQAPSDGDQPIRWGLTEPGDSRRTPQDSGGES